MDKGVVCHGFDIFIFGDYISFDNTQCFVSGTGNIFFSLVSFIFYNLLQKGIQPNILYIHT